jgi:hypothetical protein
MGSTTVDRRKTGIPGSDAEEQVKAMGGPVARRASRTSGDGPGVITLKRNPYLDAMEEQLDTDVLPETEAEDEEWKPVRYPRSEVRRRLAEQNASRTDDRPTAVPERATRNAPQRRRTDDLPQQRQRRYLHGWGAILMGALALIFLYLIVGWIYSAWVEISNRLSYGPTPTSYLEAVVSDHDAPGHPTWFVAMNEHGTIVIQVAPGGDFSKATTYTIAAQTFHSWGNLDDVVITLSVASVGSAPNILVRLQGDPDLSHFYQRPSVTFLLLNQHPGFQVGPLVD